MIDAFRKLPSAAFYATEALTVVVVGISLWAACSYIVSRVARRFGTDEIVIPKPVQKFTGSDEALAARTAERRKVAERARRNAAHIESGSPAGAILKLVKRA